MLYVWDSPLARHRPGPWAPVIPVDLVPAGAGGDTKDATDKAGVGSTVVRGQFLVSLTPGVSDRSRHEGGR